MYLDAFEHAYEEVDHIGRSYAYRHNGKGTLATLRECRRFAQQSRQQEEHHCAQSHHDEADHVELRVRQRGYKVAGWGALLEPLFYKWQRLQYALDRANEYGNGAKAEKPGQLAIGRCARRCFLLEGHQHVGDE